MNDQEVLELVLDPVDAGIVRGVLEAGVGATASALGLTEGRIRHRYFRSVKRLSTARTSIGVLLTRLPTV